MARPVPSEHRDTVLSDATIGDWAKSAGLSGEATGIAIAIALAESGGRIGAIGGPNFDGSRDYGIWQINEKAHPQLFAQYPEWWSITNAKMMAAVSNGGTNWKPWSVYNNGKWLLYRQRGLLAAQLTASTGTVKAGEAGSQTVTSYPWTPAMHALQSIGGLLYKAGEWTGDPDSWVRVLQVAVGGALVVGGIALVARPLVEPVAGGVAGIAKKVK